MENDCVITSFSSSALSAAKSCDENIRVGYILSAAYGDYYDMKNIDFFSVNAAFLSKRTIDAIHNSGKQVYAWTVNNKDSIKPSIDRSKKAYSYINDWKVSYDMPDLPYYDF